MIIFGTGSAHVASAQSTSEICPQCKTQGSMIVSVFRKHLHVFWIPMFPINKIGAAQCQHCKCIMNTGEMPQKIRDHYITLKRESRGPLWQFTGIGIIACFFIAGMLINYIDKTNDIRYIKSPQKGDIYKIENREKWYSTLKVMHVTDDSIFVTYNQYETNLKSKVSEIEKDANYIDTIYAFDKSTVSSMYELGTIYSVDRK